MKYYSTKKTCEILGIHPNTLRAWDNKGKIKAIRTPANQRRFSEAEIQRILKENKIIKPRCVIYARCSSHKQTQDGNLTRQKERLILYAVEKGYDIVKIFAETASGINENRKQLKKLLSMVTAGEVDIVLIEFKDRLARFGYSYLQEFIESHSARVEVVTQEDEPKDATQELVEDMLAIVASFSARLYGQRSQQFKKKVKELIDKDPPDGKSNQNNQSQN